MSVVDAKNFVPKSKTLGSWNPDSVRWDDVYVEFFSKSWSVHACVFSFSSSCTLLITETDEPLSPSKAQRAPQVGKKSGFDELSIAIFVMNSEFTSADARVFMHKPLGTFWHYFDDRCSLEKAELFC